MQNLPILYSFRRCPYAMRARLAIIATNYQCVIREILLKDKPKEMLYVSPKGTVPVLVLPDGQVIDESLDIMLYVFKQNDNKWLENKLDKQLELIQQNDTEFKKILDQYKYVKNDPPDQNLTDNKEEEFFNAAIPFLESLNKKLNESSFLFGDKPGLADLALFPFVRQFAKVNLDWFDKLPLQSLQSWLKWHLSNEWYAVLMEKYPVWNPGDTPTLYPA